MNAAAINRLTLCSICVTLVGCGPATRQTRESQPDPASAPVATPVEAADAMPGSPGPVADSGSLGPVADSGATSAVAPTETVELHVDATSASTTGTGSKDAPFRSIKQARDSIRTARSKNTAKGNVVVHIHAGTYEQTEPLVFESDDGGDGKYTVTYRAAGGEKPVIVGGRRLTGWTKHNDTIYKLAVPEVKRGAWDAEVLIENGAPATKARFPNEGYLKSASGKGRSTLVVKPGSVPDLAGGADAQVVIWAGHDWFANVVPIKSIDATSNTFQLDGETSQGIVADDRFFVQGALSLLDRPGEFYVDRAVGVVYYWPKALPIESQEIYAPNLRNVVVFKGATAENPVRSMRVEGLRLLGSTFARAFREQDKTWNQPAEANRFGLVSLTNAENIELVGNEISAAGFSGVSILENTQNITIKLNHIHDTGYHGILAVGADVGTVVAGQQVANNKSHTIEGNHIHHVGRIVGHSAGIFLFQSGENKITRNEIHHSPRYGIGMKGSPRWDMMKDLTFGGVKVTWENHWGFLTGRNNVFAFNDIHHVVLDSDDAGAITFWGTGRNNQVRSNVVHDLNFSVSSGLGQAIYLDEASDYTIVDGNLMFNLQGKISQGIFAKGLYTKLFRNIVVLDDAKQSGIRSQELGGSGERTAHHVYRKNVIVYRGQGGPALNFSNFADDRLDESDENLFYAKQGEVVFRISGVDQSLADWRKGSTTPRDTLSKVAFPAFRNLDNNDFDFGSDSPLHALGMTPLNRADVGLPPEYSLGR
jgi:Right handed beta helix region